MKGPAARALALWIGTAAGCVLGAASGRSSAPAATARLAAPAPLALVAAASMAGTVRTAVGASRRSPWFDLFIGLLTGFVLTRYGDALAAALDG